MRITKPKLEYWHLAGLLAGVVFVLLLALARLDQPVLDLIDMRAAIYTRPLESYHWSQFFLIVTELGSASGVITVAIGTAFFLRRRLHFVRRLGALLFLTGISVELAKNFVERQRPVPVEWIKPLNSYSFPSGHTALATALYGFLLVVLYRRSRTALGAAAAIIVPILIIAAVGLSRMALGMHYLTDVLGGLFLGMFWLTVVFALPHRR